MGVQIQLHYRSVNILHGLHLLLCELALALVSTLAALLAVKKSLSVLVKLELCDDNFAGVNANIDCCTVDLFPCYPLNVDNPFLPVYGNHLAFSALVCASDYADLVIFSHWNRPDLVLFPELFVQVRAHDLVPAH